MASEISWRHQATGSTLYYTLRNSSWQYWNTDTDAPAFETLTVANWYNAAASDPNYWIALAESPASSYFYVGTWPATLSTAGWYYVDVYLRAGATPAISDTLLGTIVGYWDGSTFGPWAADARQLGGSSQSATDLKDFADTGYDPSTHQAQADMTAIHGTALTETSGQLAGRFVDFFDQASVGYSVATTLASFKATGFATPTNITAGTITTVTTLTNLPAITENWLTAAGINTDAMGADALAADALAEIADAIWDELEAGHLGSGKAGRQLWTRLNTLEAEVKTLKLQASNAKRITDDRDSLLLDWRLLGVPVGTPVAGTFGSAWKCSDGVTRMLYGAGAENAALYECTSTDGLFFGGAALALDHGAGGASDDERCDVPFYWEEPGTARPERVLYYGTGTGGDSGGMFLATRASGGSWERKDPDGNVLTAPVLTVGAGAAWDSDNIDQGQLIKYEGVYYFWYDQIDTARRATGLATSTDLVTWTKHDENPMFSGLADGDYSDRYHTGEADATAGYFCPLIFRYDKDDGTPRFVMIIVKYLSGGSYTVFQVFTCPNPKFLQRERTYIGELFDCTDSPAYQSFGRDITKMDTPRMVFDDIHCNARTLTATGNQLRCLISVNTSLGWGHDWLFFDKTQLGAVLDSVDNDQPVSLEPHHRLAQDVEDTNVKGQWLFAKTRSPFDQSGNGNHLFTKCTSLDSDGLTLTASSLQYATYRPASGNIAALDAISGDFTIEATATLGSAFTSSFRDLVYYGGGDNKHRFRLYIGGAAGPTYTLYLMQTSTGNQSVSVSLGALSTDTTYRFAATKTGGKVYFFLDGTLLNAGGTAFNYTPDAQASARLYIGGYYGGSVFCWDGIIEEVRLSNSARWTTTYTAAALEPQYASSGTIFSRVFDFGQDNLALNLDIQATTPSGTTVVPWVRLASSATDQSEDIADFTLYSTARLKGQYHQYALVLATTDTSISPSVEAVYATGVNKTNMDVEEIKGVDADTAITTRVDASTAATNVSTIINRIGAWTGTGVNTILGAFKALLSKTASNPSDIGGTFDAGTDSVEAIRDTAPLGTAMRGTDGAYTGTPPTASSIATAVWAALTAGMTTVGSIGKYVMDNWTTTRAAALDNISSLGGGARTVVITVDDGSDALENAKVRMVNGAESYAGTTDADGEVTFSLDDATWTVTITKPLYTFTSTMLVVDGAEAETYSMTAASVPASDPTFVTGYLYCYDEDGVVEAGAVVDLRIYSTPTSGTGVSYDSATRSETSDATGLVSFSNLTPGASYKIRRGHNLEWETISITSDATSPVALTSILGEDS